MLDSELKNNRYKQKIQWSSSVASVEFFDTLERRPLNLCRPGICECETSVWVNFYLQDVLQVKMSLSDSIFGRIIFFDWSSQSENPAPFCALVAKRVNPLCRVYQRWLAAGILPSNRPMKEGFGSWNRIFSPIMGSRSPSYSTLEALRLWRRGWYQDIINTETKPPPPAPDFVSSLIGLAFQLINITAQCFPHPKDALPGLFLYFTKVI